MPTRLHSGAHRAKRPRRQGVRTLLRRTAAYQAAWSETDRPVPAERKSTAARFGLAALVDPRLDATAARPIWLASVDRRVIGAAVAAGAAPAADRLDVRRFLSSASLVVDAAGVERWRLGDAGSSIRLDVTGGTLLGAPTFLAYDVAGLARLRPTLGALADLIQWATRQRSAIRRAQAGRRVDLWILELRTADALATAATQRAIAAGLFGAPVGKLWRRRDESYRSRVQRLVRNARRRLAAPLTSWFADD